MDQKLEERHQRSPYDSMSYDKSRQGKCIYVYGVNNTRRVWRYQLGNHNSYIEEEQTIQWPKEKVQGGKQRSTKQYTKSHAIILCLT